MVAARAGRTRKPMNYLSHDAILPDGVHPLVRVGSAIPDLWGRVKKRPVPYRLLPALRAEGSEEARALADGIESHLLADDAFHAHPEFCARIDRVEEEIAPLWPTLGHGELAAHILVEMMLDRWIMQREPERLGGYYACFTEGAIELAARLGTTNDVAREGMHTILGAFAGSRFLEGYEGFDGLVYRFSRVWMRTPFAEDGEVPQAALAEWMASRFEAYGPGSETLIEAARQAIAPLGL